MALCLVFFSVFYGGAFYLLCMLVIWWIVDIKMYGVLITTPQPVIFPFPSANHCEESRKCSIRLEVKWGQSNPFRYQGRYINGPLNRVHAPVSCLSVHLGSKTIDVSSMRRSVCLFKIKTRNHYIQAAYYNSKAAWNKLQLAPSKKRIFYNDNDII